MKEFDSVTKFYEYNGDDAILEAIRKRFEELLKTEGDFNCFLRVKPEDCDYVINIDVFRIGDINSELPECKDIHSRLEWTNFSNLEEMAELLIDTIGKIGGTPPRQLVIGSGGVGWLSGEYGASISRGEYMPNQPNIH